MLAQCTTKRFVKRDPADWHCSVRRTDGVWLARPEPEPDAAVGNADPWTRRFADVWHFEDKESARRAAMAHGCDAEGFTIHWVPNRGGEWLKAKGSYGPRVASQPTPLEM